MLTAKEYLDMSSDNEKSCELHNIICEYLDSLTFNNCSNMMLRLAQDIPLNATNLMPVVIQIGVGTTLYPVRQKSGHNLYATQIRTRRNYVLHVAADSSTFTLIHGCLNNCNCGAVASLS